MSIAKIKSTLASTAGYYYREKVTMDCADLAIKSLVLAARKHGYHIKMKIWDASRRKWIWKRSRDYKSRYTYAATLMKQMTALNLMDNSKKKSFQNLAAGDLILFDLRFQGNCGKRNGYCGHTMIVYKNDTSKKQIRVYEGHTGDSRIDRSVYSYQTLNSKWKGPEHGSSFGNEFDWKRILDR